MPTSSGFLQFSIGEELSGYKIDVKTALIGIVLVVLIIKIFGLVLQ